MITDVEVGAKPQSPMRSLLFPLSLVIAACASAPTNEGDVVVVGRVERTEVSSLDGEVALYVDTDKGPVTVLFPTASQGCAADRFVTGKTISVPYVSFEDLMPGDWLRITAAHARTPYALRVCGTHHGAVFLSGAGKHRSGPVVARGVYTSGFEYNYFRPCDDRGEVWSAEGEVLENRVSSVRDSLGLAWEEVIEIGLEVAGELSEEGMFGHMGMHPRLLVVQEVRSFESMQPEDYMACR